MKKKLIALSVILVALMTASNGGGCAPSHAIGRTPPPTTT